MRLLSRLTLCVAIALPALAQAAAVVRGPFLQQTSARSTLVVVNTDVAATVRVVAEPAGLSPVAVESPSATHHVVRVDGLPPASAIPYRVEVDGAEAKRGTIHTPGEPGTGAGRRAVLGVIGDFGTKGANELGNAAQLAKEGVDALLTVGDNSYPDGAAAEWDATVFQPMGDVLANTTFWPVAGDHEYRTAWAQPYLDAFELPSGLQGERYYSFDWGDLHVVAIDTNCITPVDAATAGCDAATMLKWVRDDLAASKAPWKAAIFHRPVLATGHYPIYTAVQDGLMPLLEEFHVDLVLQGHNHLYERTWPTRGQQPVAQDYDHRDAPVYVTTGGGGDWLYDFSFPPAAWTAYREKTAQHLVLTLDGGSLRVDSVRPDGTVHDTFTITKDVPPVPDTPTGVPELPGGNKPVGPGCASGGGAGLLALTGLALAGFRRRRARRQA